MKTFEIFGPKGGRTDKELAVVKVERMPPTLKKGRRYVIIDPTYYQPYLCSLVLSPRRGCSLL
ncbi:MAG: hypothetical protein CL941_08385 [Desulfobacter sp.]|jgi:hypothetical protein|nr:hypothetical protein [Desulfobacter sp.]